jgi:hypothetical protein
LIDFISLLVLFLFVQITNPIFKKSNGTLQVCNLSGVLERALIFFAKRDPVSSTSSFLAKAHTKSKDMGTKCPKGNRRLQIHFV